MAIVGHVQTARYIHDCAVLNSRYCLTGLEDAIKINTSIVEIHLVDGATAGIRVVTPSDIMAPNSNTKVLYILIESITPNSILSLMHALRVNSTVRVLSILDVEIDTKAMDGLISVLETNTIITSLNLRANYMTQSSIFHLMNTLKSNNTLDHISIVDNNIDSKDIRRLSESLMINSSITLINLRKNRIDCGGMLNLTRALAINTSITSVDICKNPIRDIGLASLADAISINISLTHLNLRCLYYAGLHDTVRSRLKHALQTNQTITLIDFDTFDIEPLAELILDVQSVSAMTSLFSCVETFRHCM